MSHEIHQVVCVREKAGRQVKCVERSDDANFAKRQDFSATAMSASLPGWEHAKTPLKHVDTSRPSKQPCETIIARRLLNHSTRAALVSTHHLHTNALLALLFIPLKVYCPYQAGLLCSLLTTPPSLSTTPPPHRQTRSLQAGSSQPTTGEDVRLQARYVSSHPIDSTSKITLARRLNGSGSGSGFE